MRNFPKLARIALVKYLERGLQLKFSLERGDWQEIERLQLARNAAFHNFRATDALARLQGDDLALDNEVQDIYQQTVRLNQEIESLLLGYQQEQACLASSIFRSRKRIQSYKTQDVRHGSFSRRA